MAASVLRLSAKAKLVLVPLSIVTLGGAGAVYATYMLSREYSGSALHAQYEKAGKLTRLVANGAAITTAAGFLLIRQSKYKPLSISEIMRNMVKAEAWKAPTPASRSVSADGVVTIVSPRTSFPTAAEIDSPLLHSFRSRLKLFLQAARQPVRFHAISFLGAAAIAGLTTSLVTRLVGGDQSPAPKPIAKAKPAPSDSSATNSPLSSLSSAALNLPASASSAISTLASGPSPSLTHQQLVVLDLQTLSQELESGSHQEPAVTVVPVHAQDAPASGTQESADSSLHQDISSLPDSALHRSSPDASSPSAASPSSSSS